MFNVDTQTFDTYVDIYEDSVLQWVLWCHDGSWYFRADHASSIYIEYISMGRDRINAITLAKEAFCITDE